MSKKLLKKLEERDRVDRAISQLSSFARRNTLVAKGVITTIFSGLVLKLSLNPNFEKDMKTELIRIGIVLFFLILFILLDHESRQRQTMDDIDEKSADHLDTLQTNYVNWVKEKAETMDDPEEVQKLYEGATTVFPVMTTKDVTEKFSKGIMALNDMMINTFGEKKKSRYARLRERAGIPKVEHSPATLETQEIEVETPEETEQAFDEVLAVEESEATSDPPLPSD